MRIYVSRVNESWIVNRFRNEWYKSNKKISTKNIYLSDIVWIIAPWSIKPKTLRKLNTKKFFVQSITLKILKTTALRLRKLGKLMNTLMNIIQFLKSLMIS